MHHRKITTPRAPWVGGAHRSELSTSNRNRTVEFFIIQNSSIFQGHLLLMTILRANPYVTLVGPLWQSIKMEFEDWTKNTGMQSTAKPGAQ